MFNKSINFFKKCFCIKRGVSTRRDTRRTLKNVCLTVTELEMVGNEMKCYIKYVMLFFFTMCMSYFCKYKTIKCVNELENDRSNYNDRK